MLTKWIVFLSEGPIAYGCSTRLALDLVGKELMYDGGAVHWIELRFGMHAEGAFELVVPPGYKNGNLYRNDEKIEKPRPSELYFVDDDDGTQRMYFRAEDLAVGGILRWSFGRKWRNDGGGGEARLQVMVRREPEW